MHSLVITQSQVQHKYLSSLKMILIQSLSFTNEEKLVGCYCCCMFPPDLLMHDLQTHGQLNMMVKAKEGQAQCCQEPQNPSDHHIWQQSHHLHFFLVSSLDASCLSSSSGKCKRWPSPPCSATKWNWKSETGNKGKKYLLTEDEYSSTWLKSVAVWEGRSENSFMAHWVLMLWG